MTPPVFLQGSGSMYEFVLALFAGVGLAFLLLLAIIIINKVTREYGEGHLRRRRVELEPCFFKYAMGQGPIESFLPAPLRRGERRLVEDIFFDLGRVVKGSVRERAREAFERLGFVDHYVRRLQSRRWWARAEAAEKLGLIGSEQATRPLIERMEDPVPEVRVRAAKALGGIRTSQALLTLIRTLWDPGRWSAIRVAGILIVGGDETVQLLLKEFPGMPTHAKIAAVDIFARTRSLKATALLLSLLKESNPDLRARAAFALGQTGDPNSAPNLTGILSDPDWAVRAMAAKALGRLSEHESIPSLKTALSDPQWWVRTNAAEALKNKGEAGMNALLASLDSSDVYAAQQAVLMLQESGVLDNLVARLSSEEGRERQRALDVMARLVKLRRTDLLTEMAANHPDAPIRQRLAIILGLKPAPGSEA